MGTTSLAFELSSLLVLFLVFSVWSFKFVFNHDIIRNYTHGPRFAKSDINALVEQQVNGIYGCRLLHLDVDDEEDEDVRSQAASPSVSEVRSSSPVPQPLPPHTDKNAPLHYVVGSIFAIVTTLSVELVFLLMIQLFAGIDVNLVVFQIVINSLVILVAMVQPLLVIALYINPDLVPVLRMSSPTAILKAVVTLAVFALWFIVLNRFGTIAQALASQDGRSMLAAKKNEIVLAGISITAVLSGVGCTSTPISTFWASGVLVGSTDTTSAEIQELQINELIQSYNSTKILLRKRSAELRALQAASGGKIYNSPPVTSVRSLRGSGRQLLNRVQSFTTLSGIRGQSNEEEELTREIGSLEEFRNSIYVDLSKKLDNFIHLKRGTPAGKWHLRSMCKIFNWLFSLYCVYRIFNVLFLRLPFLFFWNDSDLHTHTNTIDDNDSDTINKNTKDALAITIAKLIQSVFGYLPISETQLINQVSFILSGSLFACSFQNVLITFKSVGRFLPTHTTTVDANVKSWLKNLIVSELLAIYVIATALLIRSNLPPDAAASMSKILSLSSNSNAASPAQMLDEVDFIDAWFDKVFGVSCLVTFCVIAMRIYIENDNGYGNCYDEEMFIEGNPGLKQS